MIDLPTDLPEPLLPLAWTLGTWSGYGTRSRAFTGSEQEGDDFILQQMRVSFEGESLRVVVETFATEPPAEPVPVTADAASGRGLLSAGELLWREEQLWTVASYRLGSKENPVPEAICDISISGSPVAGRWEARTLGPRITARLLSGEDPQLQATRMVGLVAGEFFWAQDRTLPSGEAETEFSARLARVQDGGSPQ